MKIILPLAGLGTRLRPHTYTRPKPLVSVAGKPVLAHILDQLLLTEFKEIIFIVGYLGDQIEQYVAKAYPQVKARYIEQKELRGQAHAIRLAKGFLDGEVLIIFGDTITEADFGQLKQLPADGALFVKAVDDPARFGVCQLNGEGYITRLVEKPQSFVSNLAAVGISYFKDSGWLLRKIDELIERGNSDGKEFYLAEPIQAMIDEGAKFKTLAVEVWEDCGTVDALLQTNRYLLSRNSASYPVFPDAVIIPPVYIAPGVILARSVIGPYVSIGEGARISNSIVRDSIINDRAEIRSANLNWSIIGSDAVVTGPVYRLNQGDNSEQILTVPK